MNLFFQILSLQYVIRNLRSVNQQTFLLMKTSWKRLEESSCLRFQKTFSRRLDQDKYIRLSHASSEDVFKTSSRHFEDVFKTSWRHFQDVLQRYLQDVFKTYHQVKLFLLTRLPDIFNTFLRRTAKVVIYRRICQVHLSEKFMVSVQNLQVWLNFLKF